jgi:hypothetical protein
VPPTASGLGQERERRLLLAVAIVTGLVVLAAVILAILEATGQKPLATAPAAPSAPSGQHRPGAHRPASRTTTPGTTPVVTPGAAPAIASLSPSSGTAGQVVTVAGSNFMSADGHIAAHFDGQAACIACPSPAVCTVTVPTAVGAANPARVTVTTDAGVSNAANFTYR